VVLWYGGWYDVRLRRCGMVWYGMVYSYMLSFRCGGWCVWLSHVTRKNGKTPNPSLASTYHKSLFLLGNFTRARGEDVGRRLPPKTLLTLLSAHFCCLTNRNTKNKDSSFVCISSHKETETSIEGMKFDIVDSFIIVVL
jgi:hypothetical protein